MRNRDTDNGFFTQANNFTSAVSGGVDPRTGLFNISLHLGTLKGNDRQGPDFPVVLSYSPLSQNNLGFGTGFTLGMSSYDSYSGSLSLSTGEQYTVENGDQVRQKHLDNFRFERVGGEAYKITYNTGTVEYLMGENYGDALKFPTRIVSAAGHTLTVSTDDNNRLTGIADNHQSLLTIDYPNNYDFVVLTLYPKTGESLQVVLETDSGRLIAIRAGKEVFDKDKGIADPSPLTWTIEYDDLGECWGQWAYRLTSPGGMQQTATWRNDDHTHCFPASAPQYLQDNPLPFVEKFEQNIGGQTTTTTWDYSGTNFLGYGSETDWDALQDTTYNCLTDYTYDSTASRTWKDADNKGVTTCIKRTFNNYHLQIEEETTNDSDNNQVTSTVTYGYAVTGKSFDNQDVRCQLPTKTETTWSDGKNARTETVTMAYDDKDARGQYTGNLTKKTDADGTVTTRDYYPEDKVTPADADGFGCPPDPNGFKRFIRTTTVTPRVTEGYPMPARTTRYQYDTFGHTGSDVQALVMKSRETLVSGDALLRKVTYDYGSDAYAGALIASDVTHHGQNGTYTSTAGVNYADDSGDPDAGDSTWPAGAAYKKTWTVTSHDNLTLTREQVLSRTSGRVWKTTDEKGNVAATLYDFLGRRVSQTQQPGTKYENLTQCDYQLKTDDASQPFHVTVTDALGNKVRHRLDAAGRASIMDANNIDAASEGAGVPAETWYPLQQQTYDTQGRVASATVSDYHTANAATPSSSLTQTTAYDTWGQPVQSSYSHGVLTVTQTDPVGLRTLSRTQSQDGTVQGGLTVTTYDVSRNPVKTALFSVGAHPDTDKPYSTVLSAFDGRNQLRRQQDEVGNVTTYDYDEWGRVTTTTLPDGSQVQRGYADFFATKLPASVAVATAADKTGKRTVTGMGTQTFDGLGRITENVSQGYRTTCSYSKASDRKPTEIKRPDGIRQILTYEDKLGELSLTRTAGGISQSWKYHPVTAAVQTATENNKAVTYDYWSSGRQKTGTVDRNGQPLSNGVSLYSAGGAVLNYQDFSGTTQSAGYDDYGRPLSLDYGTRATTDKHTVALTYDKLGRVATRTVRSPDGSHSVTTTFTFDDFGRETDRVMTDAQGDTLSIHQEWNLNHTLNLRRTSRNTSVLREETYTYTCRNQLLKYAVAGSELPADSNGLTITEQRFYRRDDPTQAPQYDVYGNILRRETTYADGSENVTIFGYSGDKAQPCLLTTYSSTTTDSHGKVIAGNNKLLMSDSAGRLTNDEEMNYLTYDALGRLSGYALSASGQVVNYTYDAHNQLAGHNVNGQDTWHYYQGNTLSYLQDAQGNGTQLLSAGGQSVAQIRSGENAGVWLTRSDAMGSVLSVSDGSLQEDYRYSPYGEQKKPS
ncbi:YD repeat (two copies) [Serratia plymuthica]|nr:YD repeat (two copies) [Serratia plymuthica]VEI19995.1 YD repeat (two copies) [Serratia plymuthica]